MYEDSILVGSRRDRATYLPFGPPKCESRDKIRFAYGHAFITDSNLGAILSVDLTTGQARRLLEGHVSTTSEPNTDIRIDDVTYRFSPVHADGIAIDPQFEYIYYKPLTGRTLFRVPARALIEQSLSGDALERLVETVAVTEPTGGIEFDSQGNLYMTAVQEDAIKVLRPEGRLEFFARATDFIWPDTISIGGDGDLVFTAAQLHLMPARNGGVDKRSPLFKIFRLKLAP